MPKNLLRDIGIEISHPVSQRPPYKRIVSLTYFRNKSLLKQWSFRTHHSINGLWMPQGMIIRMPSWTNQDDSWFMSYLSVFLSFTLPHLLFFFPCFFPWAPKKHHGKIEGFGHLLKSGCYFTIKKPSKHVGFFGQKWYTYMDGWFVYWLGFFILSVNIYTPLSLFPPEKSYGPPRGPCLR